MPITCFLEKGPLDGGIQEMEQCYQILKFPPLVEKPSTAEFKKFLIYELNYYNEQEAQATYFFYGYDE